MKTSSKKIVAALAVALPTALAAALITGSATPASATGACFLYCPPPHSPPKKVSHHGGTRTGKLIVGCVMGSALGLILASSAKGGGMKWMSQKEYEDLKVKVPNPLTNEEAATIAFTCGLGAFPVMASWRQTQPQPVVVRAGG
jgi:hypothetical protein